MNLEEISEIVKLVKEFSDIFHIEGDTIIFTSTVKYNIKISNEIPVYTKSYRHPKIYRKEVQK